MTTTHRRMNRSTLEPRKKKKGSLHYRNCGSMWERTVKGKTLKRTRFGRDRLMVEKSSDNVRGKEEGVVFFSSTFWRDRWAVKQGFTPRDDHRGTDRPVAK